MKKIISIVAMIMTVAILIGCGVDVETFKLEGIYLTFENGAHMIVDENNGPIVMANETGEDDIFDDLNSGNKIRVEVDSIAESYPGQTTIYDLEFVEAGSVDEISENVINSLIDMGWIIK